MRPKLTGFSKELRVRAEATALYHSKHIKKLLDDLIEEFDKLSIEEKITKDPDVLARIDNERINLNDIIEDLLEKINGIMNKILH